MCCDSKNPGQVTKGGSNNIIILLVAALSNYNNSLICNFYSATPTEYRVVVRPTSNAIIIISQLLTAIVEKLAASATALYKLAS